MKIGYLYLLLTIFFDSIGISLLNKANGVTDLKYLLLGLFFLI
jgi:multidrug transporter EmrE-like cation transporter